MTQPSPRPRRRGYPLGPVGHIGEYGIEVVAEWVDEQIDRMVQRGDWEEVDCGEHIELRKPERRQPPDESIGESLSTRGKR